MFNKNNPLIPLGNLVHEIFNEGFDFDQLASKTRMRSDVKEYDTSYSVEVEIPGFSKEDISINYENEFLNIKVESKKEDTEEENLVYLHRERVITSLLRSFRIKDVDESGIEASFENGLLTVILPKKKLEYNSKTINIK